MRSLAALALVHALLARNEFEVAIELLLTRNANHSPGSCSL